MSQAKRELIKFKLSSTSDLWDREYTTKQVIPSSTRQMPSKALVLFSELLGFREGLKVLDVGCGIGRNSVYLAQKGCEVHALDFSKAALQRLDQAATEAGVRSRIISYNHSLETPLPFPGESFDLLLDSYVSCHFTDENLNSFYRQELYRLTKPTGMVFSSVFSNDDEYYQEMLSPIGSATAVVDPNNGLTKRLYTEEGIKTFFSVMFDVLYFVKFQFIDKVLRRPYKRSILVLILKKQI